ncbi:MAG: hypothetical protein HKN82_13225 [Akkermansiaceae bacterium]|nr:hypothetical protein [Akkermansiaceae bacterium]
MARRRNLRGGFALILSIALLALLGIIAIGFLSLSTIQIRSTKTVRYDLQARANARLALTLALGELQTQLGPDQRVSAPAAILDGNPQTELHDGLIHPHWTGVWSTKYSDDRPMWERDSRNGGLRDLRTTEGWNRSFRALSYLVSGNEGGREVQGANLQEPDTPLPEDASVRLVGPGSLGESADAVQSGAVDAQLVDIEFGPEEHGRYAYWVGDLGVRANVRTREHPRPAEGRRIAHTARAEMISDAGLANGPQLTEAAKEAVVSARQIELAPAVAPEWRREHFHDITVDSLGVLANVRDGGLKRDLTAYLQGEGRHAPLGDRPGLTDQDRLVGPANAGEAQAAGLAWSRTKHRFTSPRFGVLRSWLEMASGSARDGVVATTPKVEPRIRFPDLDRSANVNLKPATIASFDRANLTPILVEGSLMTDLSGHTLPGTTSFLGGPRWQTRLHLYPRVVLWNPYSVKVTLPRAAVMMQVNGRKEYHMPVAFGPGTRIPIQMVWLWRGRPVPIENSADFWEHYENPYAGSLYFSLPRTTFGPGECLVFTCATPHERDRENLAATELSCEVLPHPNRNCYSTNNNVNGGFDGQPVEYWEAPVHFRSGFTAKNQADDYQMVLKELGSLTTLSHEEFDELPLIMQVSCSLQYGAGKEPRIAWDRLNPVQMEELPIENPVKRNPPDVRTRDGFRMRWFVEPDSNTLSADGLRDDPEVFESALFGNWNPRAAYALRTPWENIAGSLPANGFVGGPWFFGAYTRDLFDEDVDWASQQPVMRNGRAHGNPFGPNQDFSTFQERYILFDVPDEQADLLSLAEFQHAKLSEFVWHPSFAVGNSLVDPRVGRAGTYPRFETSEQRRHGGWIKDRVGWSSDPQRSADREEWARFGRALLQDYSEEDLLVYDLSFELNHTLWDEFFLSTGTPAGKGAFLEDPDAAPLPNGRHVLAPATRSSATPERLGDLHHAAAHLMVDGAFNVNSTSVDAWKALLASTRGLDAAAGTPLTSFSRFRHAPGEAWGGGDPSDRDAWSGFRALTDEEIGRLAEQLVIQVKQRGPFLSLSDFVNRRLKNDKTGMMGPLQAAIEAAGLNDAFHRPEDLPKGSISTFGLLRDEVGDYRHPDNIDDATTLDQMLKPPSKAWGAPGYLTQADVLQVIGPALSARSDTFLVRSYGEAVDADGAVRARAWCEAVVQRTTLPIHPDSTGLDSRRQGAPDDFGRRFEIVSFRWLHPDEV